MENFETCISFKAERCDMRSFNNENQTLVSVTTVLNQLQHMFNAASGVY